MNIQVSLTDEELSLIVTSLQMTIATHEKYVQINGESGIDSDTKSSIEGIKNLYDRLNKDYY